MSQTGILTKAKKKFIGDKAFYRYLIFLAFPMIVQNGITSFVSFLDNIMVGADRNRTHVRRCHCKSVIFCI